MMGKILIDLHIEYVQSASTGTVATIADSPYITVSVEVSGYSISYYQ